MKGSANPAGIKAVPLFDEIETIFILVEYKTNIQSKLDTNTLISDKSSYVVFVCWCLLLSLLKASEQLWLHRRWKTIHLGTWPWHSCWPESRGFCVLGFVWGVFNVLGIREKYLNDEQVLLMVWFVLVIKWKESQMYLLHDKKKSCQS